MLKCFAQVIGLILLIVSNLTATLAQESDTVTPVVPVVPDTTTLHPDTTLIQTDSLLTIDTTVANPVITVLTPDTLYIRLDSSKVYYFFNDFETKGPDFTHLIDTNISGAQKYDPPHQMGKYYATLGNPGLAHVNMVYDPRLTSGFNFGVHSFNQYLFFK